MTEDQLVADLGTPVLLAANRQFHRLLVTGVPVQYALDGETRGDFVKLVDWAEPARNEWLAVTGCARVARQAVLLRVDARDNACDVCHAFILSDALSAALAQAISLIEYSAPAQAPQSPPSPSRRPRQRQKKRVSKRV